MGRSVKYSSQSTMKRNYQRLVNHLHKLLNQARHQIDLTHDVHPGQPIEAQSRNNLDKLVPPAEHPQLQISDMEHKSKTQTSNPMTMQDLKNFMSSATNEIEEKRKKETKEDMEKRKKERSEDLEKLKVMMGLPP